MINIKRLVMEELEKICPDATDSFPGEAGGLHSGEDVPHGAPHGGGPARRHNRDKGNNRH